ncbi:serine/threonine protein kinase [Fusarium bulbicola]|nr:serine/threonine protein kinase [Fusarium bulbicola]
MQQQEIDTLGVVEAMATLDLNTHQTTDSSPEDDPSIISNVPTELSPIEALSLICPISVLSICASPFQPASHEMLWRTQMQIAAGSYGRVSVGPLLKEQMNANLTYLSGRESRWPGDVELVAFKSPKDVDEVITEIGDHRETPSTIHFKDIIPELTLLTTPNILYHKKIVDLLGYVWEPYGGVGQVRYAPTLILEFTELGPLRLFLQSVPDLDIRQRIRLCADICQALITLHQEIEVMGRHVGVFHGDLKPETEDSCIAKLCDLGSCMRYSDDTPLDPNKTTPGTPGWGSPESTGSNGQLIHPLSSEIFSFGLLVAYIILGMDAYKIPEVEKFLVSASFSSGAGYGPAQVAAEMNRAQQWMINNHFDLFVDSIFRAVQVLNLPEKEGAIVRSVLHQTLVFAPEQRAHGFSDIFDSLEVKYATSKHRTPREPIMNTMEDPTSRISIHWALALVTSTATMDHHFHEWLGQHLEVVFNHLISKNSSSLTSVISHVALLRGLLAFLPPNVGSKMAAGEMWLTRAASYGDPDVSVLAYRLLAAQDHTSSTDFTDRLVHAAKAGSILARESGVVTPSLITGIDENVFLASVQDSFEENAIWPMHLLAFLRDEVKIRSLVEIFIGQKWDLQTKTWLGVDQVNGGYLTYSMTMPGTALHWAVQMNNLAAVKALVEAGATPYTSMERRRNAWAVAVGARLLPIVMYFVESCTCTDIAARSHWTVEALFYGIPEAYLACGEKYVEASCETFRYLFGKGILPRREAYASTVSLGSGDARLLKSLLEKDYDEERDLDMVKRLLIDAAINCDISAVQILLGHLPRFETSDYSIHALTSAITSRAAEDDAVFKLLLQHVSQAFDINARFTHLHVKTHQSPVISEIEGHTLLHSTFDHGKINMAIELLRRGADPKILSIDKDSPGTGMNAFGRLFFANTHHNHLALKRFLQSEYIREHTDFLFDNFIIIPASNRNIFHLLTSDEDSRVHDSFIHQITALKELLGHMRKAPSSKTRVRDLLNTQTIEAGGELGFTPLFIAAVSGFADAVRLLVAKGADPLFRIMADAESGIPGLTPLHVVDTRSLEAWKEDWLVHEKTLLRNGVPWFEMRAPVAQKWASDYEERTWETICVLKQILIKTPAGRELWKNRKEFRSQQGLRIE